MLTAEDSRWDWIYGWKAHFYDWSTEMGSMETCSKVENFNFIMPWGGKEASIAPPFGLWNSEKFEIGRNLLRQIGRISNAVQYVEITIAPVQVNILKAEL